MSQSNSNPEIPGHIIDYPPGSKAVLSDKGGLSCFVHVRRYLSNNNVIVTRPCHLKDGEAELCEMQLRGVKFVARSNCSKCLEHWEYIEYVAERQFNDD